MSFFGNDAINRVNLHTGIFAFANGAGGIFFTAVLLKAGLSLPMALFAHTTLLTIRFLIRPAILPFAKRWGLKPLLIAGTIGLSLHYPILPHISGVSPLLFLMLMIVAVAEVFYFPSYHTYFATLGDVEARGKQIAVREALAAVAGVVAPLLGTWVLVATGPNIAFLGVAIIQLSAVVPLIGLPNVPVVAEAPGVLRAARLGGALFALDGWFQGFGIAWQAVLFVTLSRDYATFGGAMALAGLVGAAYGLFMGHSIDAGRGSRAVATAFSVAGGVVIFRAASLVAPWLAVIANAAGAVVGPLYAAVVNTPTYNLSKAAPCSLRYNMALEGGWDAGCASACLVAGLLIAAGVSPQLVLLLALPGLATTAWLLRRYYAAVAA
jgi:MFS family permease